jgi:hypothetical protein
MAIIFMSPETEEEKYGVNFMLGENPAVKEEE